MIRINLILIASVVFLSCKKENTEAISFSEATYSMTITGKWGAPLFSVPSDAHFTTFVGMVHNKNVSLWRDGAVASEGTENVAEVGNATVILREIEVIVSQKNAIAPLRFSPPLPTASVINSIYFNSNYSYLSLVSMVAPSPDWFVGLSSINLSVNNKWISDTTINLFVYDAGTEDGDVFGYNNPPTLPQQNITKLKASNASVLSNNNSELGFIATIRLTKL